MLLFPVAAHAAEGMPQLDFANPLMLGQIVWLAIIFAAFYWLVSRSALPRVGAVLERRAAAIASDLEAARAAQQQADAAVAELTAATREAQQTAAARIAEATEKARAEAARQAVEEDRKLEAQLAEADRRIGAARTAALDALRDVAANATMLVVGRLAGRAPDKAAIEAEVDRVMGARAHKVA